MIICVYMAAVIRSFAAWSDHLSVRHPEKSSGPFGQQVDQNDISKVLFNIVSFHLVGGLS